MTLTLQATVLETETPLAGDSAAPKSPRLLHVAAGNLYGGVERMLATVARHRSCHAGPRHEFALCFPGRLREELQVAGATVHDLGAASFRRPWTVLRARRKLRGLMKETRTECVVFHGCWPLAALGWRTASPTCGAMLWAHDAVSGRHWVERLAARRHLDRFIANSQWVCESAHRWRPGLPGSVVCCPVALPQQPLPRSGRIRRELGVDDRAVVVVQVSRMEEWKGHRALIAAAGLLQASTESLSPWEIWFVGGAQRPEEQVYHRSLVDLVATHQLEHRIRWLGQRSDVTQVLADADVFCQPNRSPEPLGIVFLEAMAQGLPVVTSNFGGAREIVPATAGRLVTPGDETELARTLRELLSDPILRTQLQAAGPGHARRLADPALRLAEVEMLAAAAVAPQR